jgi:hypothetical protein
VPRCVAALPEYAVVSSCLMSQTTLVSNSRTVLDLVELRRSCISDGGGQHGGPSLSATRIRNSGTSRRGVVCGLLPNSQKRPVCVSVAPGVWDSVVDDLGQHGPQNGSITIPRNTWRGIKLPGCQGNTKSTRISSFIYCRK